MSEQQQKTPARDSSARQQQSPPPPNVEFTIEIAHKRNCNSLWPINQAHLRGRWTRAGCGFAEVADEFKGMPDLPGMRIQVSGHRRTCRIYDPLLEPENQETLLDAVRSHQSAFTRDARPSDGSIREGVEDAELKTWAYWARRYLDNAQAVLVSGKVPSMNEVGAMEGDILDRETLEQKAELAAQMARTAVLETSRGSVTYVPPSHDD